MTRIFWICIQGRFHRELIPASYWLCFPSHCSDANPPGKQTLNTNPPGEHLLCHDKATPPSVLDSNSMEVTRHEMWVKKSFFPYLFTEAKGEVWAVFSSSPWELLNSESWNRFPIFGRFRWLLRVRVETGVFSGPEGKQ